MELQTDGKLLVTTNENSTQGEQSTPFDPSRWRPLVSSVLQLIWSERTISRAEIARVAGLSRSRVSEIVNILLPSGLVSEAGTRPSSGGRRPIGLEFQDDTCTLLGVEMGASHVAMVLTSLRGVVLASRERSYPVRENPRGTRELIRTLGQECLASVPNRTLVGMGLAVPSPIDPRNADWLSEVVLPRWEGHLGLDELRAAFDTQVLVDNDANLGALAEHWWAGGVTNLAYIKVATGIGSGHVIDGEIYRGSSGKAGEIGHLAIDPKGKPCICGLRGCLVTLVGTPALVARAEELLPEYPNSSLAGVALNINIIEEAALAGDPLAQEVCREAAGYLGVAVAGMLNLINPARVVLGGDLARLGDLLLEPLRETARRRTLVSSLDAAEIHASTMGSLAVAIGAATLVLKTALEDWSRFPVPAYSEAL